MFRRSTLLLALLARAAQAQSETPTPSQSAIATATSTATGTATATPSPTPTDPLRPLRSKDALYLQGITVWARSYQADPGGEPETQVNVTVDIVGEDGRSVYQDTMPLDVFVDAVKRRAAAPGVDADDKAAGTAAATRAGQLRGVVTFLRQRFERRWFPSGTPTPEPTP